MKYIVRMSMLLVASQVIGVGQSFADDDYKYPVTCKANLIAGKQVVEKELPTLTEDGVEIYDEQIVKDVKIAVSYGIPHGVDYSLPSEVWEEVCCICEDYVGKLVNSYANEYAKGELAVGDTTVTSENVNGSYISIVAMVHHHKLTTGLNTRNCGQNVYRWWE